MTRMAKGSTQKECRENSLAVASSSWTQPADGKTRQAALLLPPDYTEGTRLPLIVIVYGGEFGSDEIHRFGFGGQPFANAHLLAIWGYAVLRPDMPMESRDLLRQLPGLVLPAVNRVIDMGIADSDRFFGC